MRHEHDEIGAVVVLLLAQLCLGFVGENTVFCELNIVVAYYCLATMVAEAMALAVVLE